ncbi:KEOPS complex subunit Pcc1 [Halobellus captivus]|uniref:KEOPS complex subunit Pcc1 n=1 Tax=Halobellus captivus TaxID=2592614 RepID=UPI001EF055E7|nr:KEOPS complex subunit Pcc1 [Halobellus captivus]
MTDDSTDTEPNAHPTSAARECESRTARLRTTHADAETVAAALRPDNTDSMAMRIEGDTLVTRISRGTTGGLQSTVDDTVVNLTVADAIVETTQTHIL